MILGRKTFVFRGTIAIPNERYAIGQRMTVRYSSTGEIALARGLVVDFEGDRAIVDFDCDLNPPGYPPNCQASRSKP